MVKDKKRERESRYNLALNHLNNAFVAAAKRDFARVMAELDHTKVSLLNYHLLVEKDISDVGDSQN